MNIFLYQRFCPLNGGQCPKGRGSTVFERYLGCEVNEGKKKFVHLLKVAQLGGLTLQLLSL